MRPFQALFRICLGLTIFVGLDGLYMIATHYGKGDQNPILGGYGGTLNLSDAATVLVAALFLFVLTIICARMDRRWKNRAKAQSGHDQHA